MTPSEYHSADAFAVDDLIAILNRCFEGYLVPVHFDRRVLFNLIRADSVDLSASVVVQRDHHTPGIGR